MRLPKILVLTVDDFASAQVHSNAHLLLWMGNTKAGLTMDRYDARLLLHDAKELRAAAAAARDRAKHASHTHASQFLWPHSMPAVWCQQAKSLKLTIRPAGANASWSLQRVLLTPWGTSR